MADANLKYRSDDRIRLSSSESLINAVSPRISVSTITGGHRLNIVDVDGTDTVDILDGAKGDKGNKGDKGDKGDKGNTGNTGPQGPKGDKGDKGDTGNTGPQGPKGADGTVTFDNLTDEQRESLSPLMSPTTRGCAKLDEHGGLVLRDEKLGIGSLVQESDGAVRGSIAGLTAEGHAEQFSTTGKNLLDVSAVMSPGAGQATFPFTNNGISWVRNNDGSITAKGTLSASQSQCQLRLSSLLTAGTYTISGCPAETGVDMYPWDTTTNTRPKATNGTSNAPSDTGNGASFLVVDGHETLIALRITGQDRTFDLTFYPQLEAGSTATEYEPYTGGAPSPSPDYPQEIQVVRGRNLFNKTAIYKRNHLLASDGSETEFNGIDIYESIPIDPTKSYYLKSRKGSNNTSDAIRVGYYSGTTFLSRAIVFNDKLSIPANATSVRLCYSSVSGSGGEILDVQLTEGSTPQPYVPYGHVGMEVQGKNLLKPEQAGSTTTNNGVTFTTNADGSVTVNGTASASAQFPLVVMLDAGVYTLSGCPSGGTNSTYHMYPLDATTGSRPKDGNNFGSAPSDIGSGASFTAINGHEYYIRIRVVGGSTVNNLTFYPQLEAGSTATDYESYYHTTTPIPLPQRGWVGSLPDGTADVLMLDGAWKVEWTSATGMVTFDGSSDENWMQVSNKITSQRMQLADIVVNYIGLCSCAIRAFEVDSLGLFNIYNNYLYLDIGCTSVADARAWLSTHPVTILYRLAMPAIEDCGYVDMPTIPSECTISIPELDAVNIEYFIDSTVTELARQWYERAQSEYDSRLSTLESIVAELV